MPMYNLIEYSNNCSDTSRSLWQFKKDEPNIDNNGNPFNVTINLSSSFTYKWNILKKEVAINNEVFKNVEIAVPLKYLSTFWRSLEIPLINCKIHLKLNSTKNKNTKLYVPVVTLSTKGNVKLEKQLYKGFKRPAYWNKYKTKIESKI